MSDRSEPASGAAGRSAMSVRRGGLLGLFVRHPTAANLLMILMVMAGLIGASRLQVQFFPSINVPIIVVSVEWSGASAADVETQILDALEPKLRFLDGVSSTVGMAREGAATVTLEFDAEHDMQKALADVERAVSDVTTLPAEAEVPQVQRVTYYEPVSKVAITGPFTESELKYYALRIRDDLLDAGVEQVELIGIRDEEISVLVPETIQRELDLSIADVAESIRAATRNIPVGTLEGEREIQLRSVETRQTPAEIAEIEVRALPNGEKIRIGDFAEVETRFDRNAAVGQVRGRPAVELRINRALAADTLEIVGIVDETILRARAELPPTLEISQYDNSGAFVTQRIAILVENGVAGLVLVLVTLAVFLDIRTAFWVALGVPISILGCLAILWLVGETLNMVSVFALIMMIGIIVDDAIVVGEQVASENSRGIASVVASIRGTQRMVIPVMAATLTTAAAFVPIFAVTGPIGQVMGVIPMVVLAVLIASTIECFLVLPAHLSHGSRKPATPSAFRRRFDAGFAAFRDGPYLRALTVVVAWRYAFCAFLVGTLLVFAGLVMGERLRAHFFLSPEAEMVRASIVFVPGVPLEEKTAALKVIEGALDDAQVSLAPEGEELVSATFTTIGAYEMFGKVRLENVAQIEVALTASEERKVGTKTLVDRWAELIPPIAGVLEFAVSPVERTLPSRAIEIELQDAPLETLKFAAEEVARELSRYSGVSAILDDLPYGKEELVLELSARGSAIGFTMEIVGRQIRDLIEGATADRFVRDDEEVTIKVLRDNRGERPNLDLLLVNSPQGQWVPLSEVVDIRQADSFAIIRHDEGRRTVTVGADVDTGVTSASRVVEAMAETFLKDLAARTGVSVSFEGQTRDRAESFADLFFGLSLAGVFIYVILALVLESYVRPVFVMVIIPFGVIGALAGHLLLGLDLTIVSFVGLLGLTGVLVNDSIILIDRAAERMKAGEELRAAALGASQDRLRAIILTSVTTIIGMLPLLFETSRQAQFLIPLAVTFIFGLLVSTFIVPMLIPALFAIVDDVRRVGGAAWRLVRGSGRPSHPSTPAAPMDGA